MDLKYVFQFSLIFPLDQHLQHSHMIFKLPQSNQQGLCKDSNKTTW